MLDQVEPMDPVIEQHEGRPAQAGGEVPDIFVTVEDVLRQVLAADPAEPAEAACRHRQPQLLDCRIAAIGVAAGGDAVAAARRLDHAQRFVATGRQRLLADDMRAGGERLDRLLGMQVVGSADMDHVGPFGAEQLGEVVIGLAAAERGGPGQRPAADRDDLAAELLDQEGVDPRNAAAADDRRAHPVPLS